MVQAKLTERYKQIQKKLKKHKQQHVLRFWDELDEAKQEKLLEQLESLDFAELEALLGTHVLAKPDKFVPKDIRPAPFFSLRPKPEQKELYRKARQIGEKAIRNGEVAALTVAGGQGTRLGFDGPKGAFCISPVKNKPLFQIFAEAILANQRRFQAKIGWYIMTSPNNDLQIRKFFEQNNYFGLGPESVEFFKQGSMPAFDFEGKLLLADKDSLATSPNGHGGTLRALKQNNCLEKMKNDGVKYLSYFQVDNPLVSVLDPMFIGLHIREDSEISSRTLPKVDDLERVGNFCLSDGKIVVIEYSDLPENLAQAHNPDGSRKFNAASIAVHIINVDFAERLTGSKTGLPYHRAEKKVPYLNDEGLHIEPSEPNAVKLEMFIFDALTLATKSIIFETDRAEQFSPVKNASGPDSALTCRRDMIRRAARWLRLAGIEVPRNPQGEPACTLEISPLYALDAEEFVAKKPKLEPIKMGDKVYLE
ncbi:MAG: UDPGP type 1 family protein [Actinobacteria bacterium]|nr:UDPGP type 1 family protein [Actinomycetota bacterium]